MDSGYPSSGACLCSCVPTVGWALHWLGQCSVCVRDALPQFPLLSWQRNRAQAVVGNDLCQGHFKSGAGLRASAGAVPGQLPRRVWSIGGTGIAPSLENPRQKEKRLIIELPPPRGPCLLACQGSRRSCPYWKVLRSRQAWQDGSSLQNRRGGGHSLPSHL